MENVMKPRNTTAFLRKTTLVLAAGAFVLWAGKSPAQDTYGATATIASPLPPAATQIVKLEQAKISDNTIITYINTSGSSYGLDAGQIIYLKQQGVSDAVLNAMLTQPRYSAPATGAPQASYMADAADQQTPPSSIVTTVPDSDSSIIPPATPAPAVTYVQSAPTYYYTPSYYPYYGYNPVIYFPRVSFGWNWYGGGWHWGGGWHGTTVWHGGGWSGGWHGGGSWHAGGGWSGGSHGGGSWHGGGGGHGGGHR